MTHILTPVARDATKSQMSASYKSQFLLLTCILRKPLLQRDRPLLDPSLEKLLKTGLVHSLKAGQELRVRFILLYYYFTAALLLL